VTRAHCSKGNSEPHKPGIQFPGLGNFCRRGNRTYRTRSQRMTKWAILLSWPPERVLILLMVWWQPHGHISPDSSLPPAHLESGWSSDHRARRFTDKGERRLNPHTAKRQGLSCFEALNVFRSTGCSLGGCSRVVSVWQMKRVWWRAIVWVEFSGTEGAPCHHANLVVWGGHRNSSLLPSILPKACNRCNVCFRFRSSCLTMRLPSNDYVAAEIKIAFT